MNRLAPLRFFSICAVFDFVFGYIITLIDRLAISARGRVFESSSLQLAVNLQ